MSSFGFTLHKAVIFELLGTSATPHFVHFSRIWPQDLRLFSFPLNEGCPFSSDYREMMSSID
jgi:hypothetical protein